MSCTPELYASLAVVTMLVIEDRKKRRRQYRRNPTARMTQMASMISNERGSERGVASNRTNNPTSITAEPIEQTRLAHVLNALDVTVTGLAKAVGLILVTLFVLERISLQALIDSGTILLSATIMMISVINCVSSFMGRRRYNRTFPKSRRDAGAEA